MAENVNVKDDTVLVNIMFGTLTFKTPSVLYPFTVWSMNRSSQYHTFMLRTQMLMNFDRLIALNRRSCDIECV